MSQITTEELLDEGAERTGLARNQLLLMVAKSATVRQVSRVGTDTGLVLKGGTLLTHVYMSPRQSIADADYLHADAPEASIEELERVLSMEQEDFQIETKLEPDGSKSLEGRGSYEFSDISIKPGRPTTGNLKVTISIRHGERLDDPKGPIFYHDPLLAGDNTFEIEGLTLDELSAEKVLAWSSKDLGKHFVDLAYIAREHGDSIDKDRVGELAALKFESEKHEERYKRNGVTRPSDLAHRFADPKRLKKLERDWEDQIQSQILFLPEEEAREKSLLGFDNTKALPLEFWLPVLDQF